MDSSTPPQPMAGRPHIVSKHGALYEAAKAMREPPSGIKLTPALKGLDTMLGGFRANEFTILCGATGLGKTTLLANLSTSFIETSTPHFVASVETGSTDFIRRVMSVMDQKNYNENRVYSEEEILEFLNRYENKFINKHHYLSRYDNRFSVETLMAEMRYMIEHFGIKIALIDNLNFFLETTSAQNALVEMDRVIHELIIFVKRNPIHVVMVMHPKKTENFRVESPYDIKGSSTAVQEAQNVLLFNRPEPIITTQEHDVDALWDREVKVAKCRRNGRAAGARLILKCEDQNKYREHGVYRVFGDRIEKEAIWSDTQK